MGITYGGVVTKIDDSTPIDVDVTNAVEIDDSTPINVDVTNAVEIDDSTPIDVNISELESGISVNGNSQLKTTLFDSAGNEIGTHLSADGDYHLGVQVEQNVLADDSNSSTTNLDAGNSYTFTGIGKSTLGVVGLQWSLDTDQNAMVYIEETDGDAIGVGTLETAGTTTLLGTSTVFTRDFNIGDAINVSGETVRTVATIISNTELTVTVAFTTTDTGLTYTFGAWDISNHFDYIANQGGRGETIQATKAFWRIRVVLINSTDTTYFRLSGVLCPIATPLPSALSDDGRLKTEVHMTDHLNRDVHVSYQNELNITPVYRLVGSTFTNANDPNFWTETIANSASITYAGDAKLISGTEVDGSAKLETVQKGRFVPGSLNKFIVVAKPTAGIDDNKKRWGAYDTDNGYFFEMDGTVFCVVTRKDGADTVVASGDFNGEWGSDYVMDDNNHFFSAEFGPPGVWFFIDNKLIHHITAIGAAGDLTDSYTLPASMENTNEGTTTSTTLLVSNNSVFRIGELQTSPIYKHIASNATYVCKLGAGVLHGISVNDPAGACTVTIYDNISAAGTTIGIIELTTKVITPFFMAYDLPFSTGLTIVTSAASDFTIIYE